MIEDSYKQTPNAKFERNDPKVKKVEEYSLRAIFAEPKYDSFSLYRYAQFLEKYVVPILTFISSQVWTF